MIVRELKLHPFAGITNLEINFEEGLNVVLGPNEAGKSTLVNALKMALFMSTKYTKLIFDREIMRFMPLNGGDTIQVDLSFALGTEFYRLSKSWGQRKESTLTLPTGGLLADAQAVEDKLKELLVLNERTYQSILFAYQAGLGSTLDSLDKDPTPTEELASILRRAIFQTDGVSIERLGRTIEDACKDYFSRWDKELKRPPDNRGIDNPFKRGVGKVLGAYYEKERLHQAMQEALGHERQMDELNRKIRALADEIEALEEFVGTNRQVVDDARKRVLLETRKKALEEQDRRLRDISQKWPSLEQEIKTTKEGLKDLKKRQASLSEELKDAEAYEANKQKLEKFARAEKKKVELNTARDMLAGMKAIKEADFRLLEQLNNELKRLETSLEAGKIALTMIPEKPMELRVAKDFEDEISCTLEMGESLEVSAGGMIEVRHPDWIMKVKTGEMDFDEVNSIFNQVSREYQNLLNRLNL